VAACVESLAGPALAERSTYVAEMERTSAQLDASQIGRPSQDVEAIAGRYALFDAIGSGAYATVHLARLLGFGGFNRTVAVKRLRAKHADCRERVGMLLDEARTVGRVQHANVVQTLDVVRQGDELFLVMEYVHGDSLDHLLGIARDTGRAVPHSIAASIVAGVLHGLHAAHTARAESGEPLGIVHRDVSPQNVLIGSDGIARIGDFGIARSSQRVHTTRKGVIQGKLGYMAPEQFLCRPLDARTDVYAAGVMLWEALTGTLLFDGNTDPAVHRAALASEVRRPSEVEPSISGALEAIVMKAIARDPGSRFATAHEMSVALEAVGVAPASEVGAWVHELIGDELHGRALRIAQIESQLAADSMQRAVEVVEQLQSHSKAPPALALPVEARPSLVRTRRGPARIDVQLGIAGAAFVVIAAAASSRHGAPTSPNPGRPAGAAAPVAAAPAPAATASRCPPDMIAIPSGSFFMGRDDGAPFERPEHRVTLDAYCMDRTEVTLSDYLACSDAGQCKRPGATNWWPEITTAQRSTFDPLCNERDPVGRSQHPVNCVDWDAAQRFCSYRARRLPTEAEWEFAARGPEGRHYPWGDEQPIGSRFNGCGRECVAWGKAHHVPQLLLYADDDGFATTAPVGSFPNGRSPLGLEDLAGNVWEWVSDVYGPYDARDQVDPTGAASGAERALRGAAWNSGHPEWARATFRFKYPPNVRSHAVGFRCAADASRH
jgi:serine/threonine-protein kinase